jgi:hypothetical protein
MNELFHTGDHLKQGQSYAREVTLLSTFRHSAILSLHGCIPFDGQPPIITPVMKASVELKGFALDVWMPTQKQVCLPGITS